MMIIKLKALIVSFFQKINPFSPYPIFYNIRMTKSEKRLFDAILYKSRIHIEFGMGGSTIRVLQKSNAIIYSVESDTRWIETLKQMYFIRRMLGKRLFLLYVDIGETGFWGYPTGHDKRNDFGLYSVNVFDVLSDSGLLPMVDTIFVDGRFRVACTLMAIQKLSNKRDSVRIIIHDFWDRPHYHTLLKYLNVENRVDTLGVFSIKPGIQILEIRKEYEFYKFVAE